MNKVAQITFSFWIMKICATTLGETAGDLISMTLNVGYTISSIVLISIFLVSAIAQIKSKTFNPILFWMVILTTSTAGTTMSDFMDRTLNLGYATGSAILVSCLITILGCWYLVEKNLSVSYINSPRTEMFYWITILFSNTLGTALGDFLADSSGLGFLGGAVLIGTLILLTTGGYFFTKINRIALFWIAFILTRPFGATFGDLLTKPVEKGGLNLGTVGSSIVLIAILVVFIYISYKKDNQINYIAENSSLDA